VGVYLNNAWARSFDQKKWLNGYEAITSNRSMMDHLPNGQE